MVLQGLRLAGEECEDVLRNLLRQLRTACAPQRAGESEFAQALDQIGKGPLAPLGFYKGFKEFPRCRPVF